MRGVLQPRRLGLGRRRCRSRPAPGCEHGRAPRTEVLDGEVLAGQFAQVLVHVLRADVPLASPARRGSSNSSSPGRSCSRRTIRASRRSATRTCVVSCPCLPRNDIDAPGRRGRLRARCASCSRRTSRWRAYSSLPTRISVTSIRCRTAASTFSRGRPRRSRSRSTRSRSDGRAVAERHHPVELRGVADLAPLGVVAVLLAPAGIAPGRQQVTVRVGQIQTSLQAGGIGERLERASSAFRARGVAARPPDTRSRAPSDGG